VIRVLALLHVVLVTSGAMDSSWAMAKSLGMSQSQIAKEEVLKLSGPDRDDGDGHLAECCPNGPSGAQRRARHRAIRSCSR
jgi:hypothetical protein